MAEVFVIMGGMKWLAMLVFSLPLVAVAASNFVVSDIPYEILSLDEIDTSRNNNLVIS